MILIEFLEMLLAELPVWVCEPTTVAVSLWPLTSSPEVMDQLLRVSALPS